MPYKLRKAPKRDLYWVVTIETGKKHSKDPIPLAKAQAQKRILEQTLVGGITRQELIDLNAKYPPATSGTRLQNGTDTIKHYSEFMDLLTDHQREILRLSKGDPDYRNYNLLEIFELIINNVIKDVENHPDRLVIREENQQLKLRYIPQILRVLKLYAHNYAATPPIVPSLTKPKKVDRSKFAPVKRGVGKGKKHKLKGGLSPAHFNLLHDSLSDTITVEDAQEVVGTILELLTPNQRRVLRKTFIQFDVLYIDVLKALEILETATPTTPEEVRSHNTDLTNTIRAMEDALELYLPVIGIRSGAGKPSNDIMQQIAKQSYQIDKPQQKIEDWDLISFTPTLKFYRKGSDVVVGIRGTKDSRDAGADVTIIYNGLTGSDRFKADLKTLNDFRAKYPDVEYYGVGHSLGGAILDEFIKMGLIKEGLSYNPAVQPENFSANIPNHRIFEEGDPLYALAYPFLKTSPEVRKKPLTLVGYLKKKVTPASVGYLEAHKLDNFKGGAYAKGKASVFVITCIDPRYNYDVTHYLEKQKNLHKDYDLFVLAGASVGAEKKGWRKTFFDNLALGIKLHGIKEVWCFDHLDCGMYKATFGLKKDDDPKIHIQCMDKLKKMIAKKHPSLGFREFLVSAKGKVNSVGAGKKMTGGVLFEEWKSITEPLTQGVVSPFILKQFYDNLKEKITPNQLRLLRAVHPGPTATQNVWDMLTIIVKNLYQTVAHRFTVFTNDQLGRIIDLIDVVENILFNENIRRQAEAGVDLTVPAKFKTRPRKEIPPTHPPFKYPAHDLVKEGYESAI